LSDIHSKPKPTGTPFAGPSSKPWLVKGPSGIVSVIAQTVTILFRRHFGERYLKPTSLLKGMTCFAAYLAAMRLYAIGGKHSVEIPVPILSWLTWLAFASLFLLAASFHMVEAVKRRDMLPDEYSHASGRPWPLWMKLPLIGDEWDFERFYEPAIIIAAGIALSVMRNWFGPYLIIAGACAFHVAKTKHHLRRELELNVLDTRTDAVNVPRFDGSTPPPPTQGTTTVSPSLQGEPVGDVFERLKAKNPNLARQMEADGNGQAEDRQ
jgi:hypothetical protein